MSGIIGTPELRDLIDSLEALFAQHCAKARHRAEKGALAAGKPAGEVKKLGEDAAERIMFRWPVDSDGSDAAARVRSCYAAYLASADKEAMSALLQAQERVEITTLTVEFWAVRDFALGRWGLACHKGLIPKACRERDKALEKAYEVYARLGVYQEEAWTILQGLHQQTCRVCTN